MLPLTTRAAPMGGFALPVMVLLQAHTTPYITLTVTGNVPFPLASEADRGSGPELLYADVAIRYLQSVTWQIV